MPATRAGSKAGFNFTGPLAGLGNLLLSRFGVPTAESQHVRSEAQLHKAVVVAAQTMPLSVQKTLGARLPALAFVLIVGFFTYVYHVIPIAPWAIVFFGSVFAVVMCWPPSYIGMKKRTWGDWGPMASWFIALTLGIVIGQINYGIFESWINTTFLRHYENISSKTPSAAVVDAGVLKFEPGTVLQTTMSAGYKFWFYNYCAAPIAGDNPTAAPITFWAVGVGCCDSRGGFTCDSAADASARSAVPLRRYNLNEEIAEHYDHAVRMSAAANDLEVAKDKLFVYWTKDPKAMGQSVWWMCTATFLIMTLAAACACMACESGLTHMNVMQQHSS